MRVSLHIASSFDAAWDDTLLAWFRSAAQVSWQQQLPSLVVVPLRSQAYAINSRLLDARISLLGLRFVSPAELRQRLAARTQMRLALREHLRLLLSIAAEECLELPEESASREKRMMEPDFFAAKSVMRAPDHLLRAIDQLDAAGWDFSDVELPALRKIVARFHQRVSNCGFELIHTADRRALAEAGTGVPLFANILVTGFNGAYWPLWPLLRAAVLSATEATVLLDDPCDEARAIDEAWVGTWEETFGEAKPLGAPPSHVSDDLFTEEEMRGVGVSPARRSFLVGADTTEQAEAVAHQCLNFLADPASDRIGIIFSGPGALPRLVATELARLKIPHHNRLAHFVPGLFEAPDWRAWIRLQQSPRINPFLQFINALPQSDELFPDVQAHTLERILRDAYSEILIDDLEILRRFCAQRPELEQKAVATVLSSVSFLPTQARFGDFLRKTKAALERFGWKMHWKEISRHLDEWTEKIDVEFSRALYLRWLDEIALTFTAEREDIGNHPYARVQLLTVPEANGQKWSHLIFAGWNEGSWPPRERGEFARQDEIDAFNRNIQELNRRVAGRGRYGEGHTAVRENHTLYLGPAQQHQIALRQFQALFESATKEVAFTASLVQEDAPGRLWNPNELFTRHYQETYDRALTESAMSELQARTRRWLVQFRLLKKNGARASQEIDATRRAYDARRDPTAKSGEYDFAFRSKPPLVPILSVTEFEQLMATPALVWLKKYVGVKAADESRNVWNSSTGKWVHDWLAAIGEPSAKKFTCLPSVSEIERRVRTAAKAKHLEIDRLCQAAGKSIPDWWLGGWRNAVFLARALADKLAETVDWPWMATEWRIDSENPITITESDALFLRGRIDLLLVRASPDAGSLAGEELWIVDYKTGAKKALTESRPDAEGGRPALKKKLLDGSALQLGLYSLAAGALGTEQIKVSLLSPFVRQLKPQMSAADFSSEIKIFSELAKMQETGAFGMHGLLRSAYGFADDYPLATLAVDADILEQRWELTHPALVRDEEEFFW
jgi:hypothetical protein